MKIFSIGFPMFRKAPMLAAPALALLCVCTMAPGQEEGKEPESKTGVTVAVPPLEKKYFSENRIRVDFNFQVTRPLGNGTAEVVLHNTDTGENFSKTLPVELSLGKHWEWAAWGGNPPWSSTKESELDVMLGGDLMEEKEVTDGFYIPQVTIRDSEGNIVAEKKYSSDEVTYLRHTGGLSLKISKETITRNMDEMKSWLAELEALEAKAKAAGGDASLPGLFMVALRETNRQMVDRHAALQYEVINANHSYSKKQMPKIRAQLEKIIADPASGESIDIFPRPKERFTFKDGYFHSGDKPVFMLGMGMFALWPHVDMMREMNLNIIHIGEDPDDLFPDPKTELPSGELLMADGEPPYKIVDFLDKCSELGIKVDLGLTARPPKWFFEKYPEARLKGYSVAGFIPWDIEHPDTLVWVEKYFDAVMKKVGNHPALNSIWLANEPCMLNLGPYSESLFRTEMTDKYVTIEKLNEAWGSKYKDFYDIKLPLGSDAGQGNTEFWWFNVGRLTKFFQFMQQCVRKYDKNVNTCFKLNNLQMGWHCPPGNVDQEGVSDISEIIGMDSGTMPFAKPYYDWLRSLSPEKPLVNLEFKGTGWLTWWRSAFWGMACIDAWCWHGDPKFSPQMHSTAAIHQVSLGMYYIQRNIDIVMAYQTFPRSPFVVLYPDPVLPRASEYFKVHTPTVSAITSLGYATDYATEKRVAEGRLDKYKYDFLVMPSANYIKDETYETVRKYIEGGGNAIVVGEMPERGPLAQKRDLGWLTIPEGAAEAVVGVTNSATFAYGKGSVWVLPAGDAKTLQPWILEISSKRLPPRPVVVDDAFEYRTIPWKDPDGNDCYVTYILANYYQERKPEEPVKVEFSTKVKEAVDLIYGEKLDPERILVPEEGVTFFRWTPEK